VRTPDVVIGSSPHPLVAYYCQHLAKRHRVPFLFEVRDLWPLAVRDLGGFSRWHPYMLLLARAERFAVRHAAAIISVKPGDGEYFQAQYGFRADRCHYLPNGYLPPDGAETVLPAGIAGKIPAGKFVVGYVGALSYYYEIDLLLDAAAKLKLRDGTIVFVLAGAGVLGERIARRIESEGLDNVVLLGYLENRQIMPLLKHVDLCYLGLRDAAANRYGISCNKLYEYMYARKPVVACYRTSYDPVEAAQCGENIGVRDADRLAECILRMKASGRSALEGLGNNAFEYFRKQHDMNGIADNYCRLLRVVAGARSARDQVDS
jgi:glycosyltransferase involved in cell wall biosynthesis